MSTSPRPDTLSRSTPSPSASDAPGSGQPDPIPAQSSRWFALQVGALALFLMLASGGVGAFLVHSWGPAPALPRLRIAVLDMARVMDDFAGGALKQPGSTAGFDARFDRAVRRLQESEPGRLILVKEAVIAADGYEDLTAEVLQLIRSEAPTQPGARGGAMEK